MPGPVLDQTRIAGWERRSLIVGVAAAAACAVGGVTDPEQFFRSYLLGYLYWIGIALGCLGIGMLHHLTGGAWGSVIRRFLESGMKTLPVMALLFIPILLGFSHLYEWSHPEAVAADALLQHKQPYLNVPFAIGRAGFYFLIWIGSALLLVRGAAGLDRAPDPGVMRRLKIISGPGILLYVLTMTFASIDWVMSLDPHWFSTIYGMLFIVGQALSAFALAITMLARLRDVEPLAGTVKTDHFHDLGNLLFAFVFLWAYISVSQLLIIWSGNLPEEIPWYYRRFRNGWELVGYTLVLFHFALPFFVLLMRTVKRKAAALSAAATGILAVHYVDLIWIVVPEFHRSGLRLHWMDLAAPVALGGLWLWMFFGRLKGRPLLAVHDPILTEEPAHAAD